MALQPDPLRHKHHFCGTVLSQYPYSRNLITVSLLAYCRPLQSYQNSEWLECVCPCSQKCSVKASSAPQCSALCSVHPSLAFAWHSTNDHLIHFLPLPQVWSLCSFVSASWDWMTMTFKLCSIHATSLSFTPWNLLTFLTEQRDFLIFYRTFFFFPVWANPILLHTSHFLLIHHVFLLHCHTQTTFFISHTHAAALCPCSLHLFCPWGPLISTIMISSP